MLEWLGLVWLTKHRSVSPASAIADTGIDFDEKNQCIADQMKFVISKMIF